MRNKHKLMAVHPAFHRKLKGEAAKCGMKLISYTKKLSEDSETLEERWKERKKGKRFNIGL